MTDPSAFDLSAFDQGILTTAHSTSTSLLPLFLLLTYSGGALGMVALLPFLAWKKTRVVTAWLFGAILSQAALVGLVKIVIARARPCAALAWCTPLGGPCPTTGSLPSGHAAGAFTFALFVAFRSPKWAIPALLWAALVASSRCVLGMHYPTDVLLGAMIGSAFGAGFAIASKRRTSLVAANA